MSIKTHLKRVIAIAAACGCLLSVPVFAGQSETSHEEVRARIDQMKKELQLQAGAQYALSHGGQLKVQPSPAGPMLQHMLPNGQVKEVFPARSRLFIDPKGMYSVQTPEGKTMVVGQAMPGLTSPAMGTRPAAPGMRLPGGEQTAPMGLRPLRLQKDAPVHLIDGRTLNVEWVGGRKMFVVRLPGNSTGQTSYPAAQSSLRVDPQGQVFLVREGEKPQMLGRIAHEAMMRRPNAQQPQN